MAESYIISIDQSTQGTKALLFDQDGMLLQRKDLPHKQMINEKGWVSHDPEKDRACAFAVFSGFETGMAERKCRRCRSTGKETCAVFRNNRYLACIPDDTWNVL